MRLLVLLAMAANGQLLDQLFSSNLSEEQMRALGPGATHEQKAAAMTPEQREAARGQLAGAEARAATPEELKEIARGYLILNEKAPNAGQDAVRVANRLIEENRTDPEPHFLAAHGYYQQGDYQNAFMKAEEALRRNPRYQAAFSLYQLSRDRGGSVETRVPPVVKSAPTAVQGVVDQALTDSEANPKSPIRPQPRVRQYIVVPENVRHSNGPSAASKASVLDRRAGKVVAIFDRGKMTDKQRSLTFAGAVNGTIAGGAAGAVGGSVLGGIACGPGWFTGAPYALCVIAGGGGGALVGGYSGGFLGGFAAFSWAKATESIEELFNK